MANQADIAAHLDLSQQAVSRMVTDKLLPPPVRRQLDVDACRVAYIRHLREVAAGRAGPDDTFDLVQERARLAKHQADAQAMTNDLRRGQLVEVSHVLTEIERDYAMVKNRLLALPAETAAQLARIKAPAEMQKALYDAIYEVLLQLSDPAYYARGGGAAEVPAEP